MACIGRRWPPTPLLGSGDVSEQPDAPQVDLAEILVDGVRNAVDLLLPLWPLWLLVGAIGLGKLIVALYRYRRLSRST